jgi:hypothetical protein
MIPMVLRPEVAALTRKDHPAASGDVTRLVGSGKARAGEAVNEIELSKLFDLGRGRSKTMKRAGISLLILAAYASLAAADTNDYPTEARADYVFVCMKTNGETPDILRRCSCSIDVIASLLPYDHYVAAQTVASMNQVQGQIGTMFRASEQSKAMLADLRRAEAEAEIRCF